MMASKSADKVLDAAETAEEPAGPTRARERDVYDVVVSAQRARAPCREQGGGGATEGG